jgi:hypothetical protein
MRAILDGVRLTDFWERMRAEFGPTAEFLAEFHVFGELGNRTVQQALADGEPPARVWRAVCEGMDVPPARR